MPKTFIGTPLSILPLSENNLTKLSKAGINFVEQLSFLNIFACISIVGTANLKKCALALDWYRQRKEEAFDILTYHFINDQEMEILSILREMEPWQNSTNTNHWHEPIEIIARLYVLKDACEMNIEDSMVSDIDWYLNVISKVEAILIDLPEPWNHLGLKNSYPSC